MWLRVPRGNHPWRRVLWVIVLPTKHAFPAPRLGLVRRGVRRKPPFLPKPHIIVAVIVALVAVTVVVAVVMVVFVVVAVMRVRWVVAALRIKFGAATTRRTGTTRGARVAAASAAFAACCCCC